MLGYAPLHPTYKKQLQRRGYEVAQLELRIPKPNITVIPDNSAEFKVEGKCELEVELTNLSNEFASFEIELYPKDGVINSDAKWYSVEPAICSKIQPGDRTNFSINITHAPIHAYNRKVELVVKVLALEYENLFATEVVCLTINYPHEYVNIELLAKNLKAYPNEIIDIPFIISNCSPNRKNVTVTLEITNLSQTEQKYSDWFQNQENRKEILINGGSNQKDKFKLILPKPGLNTFSDIYSLTIKAEYESQNSCSDTDTIEILPSGEVKFACPKPYQKIPSTLIGWFGGKGYNTTEYQLEFTNNSNIIQTINLELLNCANQGIKRIDTEEVIKSLENVGLEKIQNVPIVIRKNRRLIGRERRFTIQIAANLFNHRQLSENIQTLPNSQILELNVKPIIPFWLQILLLAFASIGSLLLWSMLQAPAKSDGHINSVRFLKDDKNNTDIAVSGSSNQTISSWEKSKSFWTNETQQKDEKEGKIPNTGKPIRVIRERPEYNNQIIVGLDSGDMETWQVSPTKRLGKSFGATGDRVFALDFKDKDTLFSGHGSGTVRQWDLKNTSKPIKTLVVDNAISAVAVIDSSLLAVAGQYNQLVLWDWQKNNVYEINYDYININSASKPVFSKNDYINSLGGIKNTLATADNQGFITLWKINTDQIRNCIKSSTCVKQPNTKDKLNSFYQLKAANSLITKQWVAGQNQSIRSIALTKDTKGLFTVGESGRVQLWCTNKSAENLPKEIYKFDNRLRSVAIKEKQNGDILIASDAPENRVKIHEVTNNDCQ
jgi:hypothetical protein